MSSKNKKPNETPHLPGETVAGPKPDVAFAPPSVTARKHASTPATEITRDVGKMEESERAGSIGRRAHASTRTRRGGG